MTIATYIQGNAVVCGLGFGSDAVQAALFAPELPELKNVTLADERLMPVCAVNLPATNLRRTNGLPETRNNQLAAAALALLPSAARSQIDETPPRRLGVVIGTSTAGIDEGGVGFAARIRQGQWDGAFDFSVQELGDPALFLAAKIGASGPAYSVSTACTSGAKALISAAHLIEQGLCDTVLCGGVDTLCDMTVNGFGVLEALSSHRCTPFAADRSGIHIGEGAALFVLSARPAAMRIAGWGESSDAHHISAPDPEGRGAILAMQAALDMAGMNCDDVGYINLHGTATPQNDQMEARAVSTVFGNDTLCSSTKPFTGHTLGAAGAIEAAFLTMALQTKQAPENLNSGDIDPTLPPLALVKGPQTFEARAGMSCNYAFGGNNTALILERVHD
ncbi:MAG: beta-ketoacyl-ACP synthase [Pikeienuella sp.]